MHEELRHAYQISVQALEWKRSSEMSSILLLASHVRVVCEKITLTWV
jgi:hypothetical protein